MYLKIIIAVITLSLSNFAFTRPLTFSTESFPPLQYSDNNKVVGPMMEIVMAVCAEAKIECQVTLLPWKQALAQAEDGIFDGIFSIVETPERAAKFELSDPIVASSYGFFTRTNMEWTYTTPSDLKGISVHVYGPSGTSIALDAIIKADSLDAPTIEVTNLMLLQQLSRGDYGKRGAAAINSDVGMWLIRQEKIKDLKFSGDYKALDYGFGISKKSSEVNKIHALNTALKKLQASGKIKSILKAYWLKAAKPVPK